MNNVEKSYMNNMNNRNSLSSLNDLSILKIQEEERQRIAMELHDTSLQTLAHVIHQVDLAGIYMDKDIVKSKLELAEVKQNIKTVIEEIRNTIFDLRPMSFDDLGIEETIQRYIQYANKDHAFQIHTYIDNIDTTYYIIMANIYRIIQECISNAIKHSGGDEIYFKCYSKNKTCYIEIEDNGKGFVDGEYGQDGQKHFGLSVVKERVMILDGEIHISSEINKGTKIFIEIPLK
ncbi:MAG: sensor histidine kinase [Lachnospiraceae bacterium]|nr:sensor histidine kinase [Lachnospiraceae bacterium]